ncbi:MAG: D-alanine--D-alanine ligase [Bacteroidota bacterium]
MALVAGGYSGEYEISINSARVIKKNLDNKLFKVYLIIVVSDKWVYIDGENRETPVDKNDFSIQTSFGKVLFDCALITIHGTPGEDGKLQGYFDLMKIPYTTAGMFPSALTFNKYFCNLVVSRWGIPVARSVKISSDEKIVEQDILEQVQLPVFVKPNQGGSSLGTTFVQDADKVIPSLRLCFEHDCEALIEEYIEGTELTCGVYRRQGKLIVLPVTEIISKTEAKFFDYKAKYTKGAADEITPARIDDDLRDEIWCTTAFLYEKLELKGICRIDYIFSKGKLFFLEANITPGMSERSIVPQQAAHIGIELKQLFTDVIMEAIRQK